jgi:PD-(D/E)XK endonuclease
MHWLLGRDAAVFLPIGHSRDFDLITDFGDGLLRVQVKTSSVFLHGRWVVAVCTRGGNRSWSGLVKYLDPSRYDFLFAHVGDGRRWFIPASAVEGTTRVCLGGPKYSEYEIEPGAPLSVRCSTLS